MKFRDNLPKNEGGGKNYLKLKDKESAVGIFRGEPYEFTAIWKDGKYVPAPDGTPGSKFRFKINFVVKEGAAYVPKIFEQGQVVYEQLAEIHKDWPLETTLCKITRNGVELDTTYSIIPTPQRLTPEAERTLASLKLNDFEHGGVPNHAPQGQGAPMPEYNDEIPF